MEVYLASSNRHKFEEFVELVMKARLAINLNTPAAVGGMPAVEESGDTLEENARIKAEALAAKVEHGAWVLADDSGLLVDALDGAPGVYSARYAGPGQNTIANNLKLLQELRVVPAEKRTARFSCVLAFHQVGGETHLFKGSCEGHILNAPRGHHGFGYDPLFQPVGYTKSFAELGSAKKQSLSHRALAFKEWAAFMRIKISERDAQAGT